MLAGIGVDIVAVERLRRILDGPAGEKFVQTVFAENETASSSDSVVHYATRFAIKEAVLKCFHVPLGEHGDFRAIEVCNDAAGAPQVSLHGRFEHLAAERGAVEVQVSVAYEDAYVIAVAALTSSGER